MISFFKFYGNYSVLGSIDFLLNDIMAFELKTSIYISTTFYNFLDPKIQNRIHYFWLKTLLRRKYYIGLEENG